MTDFPAFTRLEHAPGNAAQSLLAEINSALAPAERRLAEFSTEAQRQLDTALSMPRNASGSLDLDVAGLRATAAAMEARAIAAREVASATALAAQENRDESESARLARVATEALAVEYRDAAAAARSHADAAEQVQTVLNRQKSATDAVIAAQRQGTTALGAVTNSARANRVAFVQLGQQMQDVTIQAQMGTNAFQIFTQQVPQAAFALSGLTGAAGSAAARVGAFATFLSGPWGAAIFAATAVLGPFIYSLFQSGEAADESEDKHRSLLAVLDDATASYEAVMEALRAYNNEQERSAQVTLATLNLQLQRIQANFAEAISARQALQAEIDKNREMQNLPIGTDITGGGAGFRQQQLGAERASQDALIAQLRAAQANAITQVAGRAATIANDPSAAIRDRFETRRQELAREGLSVDQLTAAYTRLGAEENAALSALRSGRGGGGSGSTERQAQQLARFGESAAEQIARINERFDEQPRLIDQASQATRQLDDIISRLSDTTKQQPENFRELIAEAQAAKEVIQDALVRPILDMEEASDRRLQVQNLLLGGREAEAEVLQRMWDLEAKLGPLAWQSLERVRDQVEYERDITEEIERRLAIQKAYLGATQSIRNELESLFAGDGANFRQVARRLQSQVFVEEMFGDALRQIDREVQSGFDDQVDYLEQNSRRAQEELGQLATTVQEVTRALANPNYRPNLPAGVTPANDNAAANSDIIEVTASRSGRGTLGNMNPQEYFDLVGRRMAAPIIEALETQIGTRLPAELSGALSGAIGGYLGGGPVGGVLGALQGIFGDSAALSGMFGGSQMGGTVNGLLGMFGINGSGTGAAIGGALGSLTGIPGANIAGSLAGSLIGKAGLGDRQLGLLLGGPITYGIMSALGIGGTKWGTASFSGGSTSISGSGASRREGATALGTAFTDALDAIAEQLDAQLGDFAVSIGSYGKKFRVSGSGKNGKIKKGDGVQTFEDEAAAQTAALMDAIADGAIRGLSEAEKRRLTSGGDLDKALQDVLDFRSVFDRLKAYKDPVGAALDDLDSEFSRLGNLFDKMGASAEQYAQLEELYGLERAKAIKDATEQMTGSLRALLDELNIGDNGLSLRDRQANAITQYDALKTRVQAGDTTANDAFAEAAKTLLDLERQIYGSQSGYFTRFDEVRGVTQGALTSQEAAINAAINRDSPFTGTGAGSANDNSLIAAIDRNSTAQLDQLVAVNDNLARGFAAMVAAMGGSKKQKLAAFEAFTNNF